MNPRRLHILAMAAMVLVAGGVFGEPQRQQRRMTFGAAMRSFGVYRQQDNWEKAVEMLELVKMTQFFPIVVNALTVTPGWMTAPSPTVAESSI